MLNIDDRLIKEIAPKIKPNALSVLLAIAIHLNRQNGKCFPSHSRLMQLTGLGRDAVYAALEVLKNNDLLKTEQAIDSKNKTFGRRTFKVSTRYIKIFIDAEDAEPLPENPDTAQPDTAQPDTAQPDTANQETQQLNNAEQINNAERINNVGVPTPAPEIETIKAEKEIPPPSSAPPPPPGPQAILTAERQILSWAKGEGLETVKLRCETARRAFSEDDLPGIVAHYVSIYGGTSQASKETLLADPVGHFATGFYRYLVNQNTFDRGKPGESQQKTTGRSTLNRLGADPAKYAEKPLF